MCWTGRSDIRVYDFEKQTLARLTFGGTEHHSGLVARWPVRLLRRGRSGDRRQHHLPPGGGWQPRRGGAGLARQTAILRSISSDGARAHIDDATVGQYTNIGFLPLGKGGAFFPIVATKFDEFASEISPDGRWIAYQANDTSRYEVYVREVSGSGLWQISTDGGEEPRWSPDGRSIYYRNDTHMMVAPVETRGTFQNGTPRLLFDGVFNLRSDSGNSYDLAPNGDRFLMLRSASETGQPSSIRVVVNWAKELEGLAR